MQRVVTHRPPASVIAALLVIAISPIAAAQSAWPVNLTPIFAVGGGDGGPDQELNRVSGAIRLADGRVVVANGKPLELRVYSAKGALLTRIGRQGGGPGEFRGGLQLIAAGGDTVVIFASGSRWEMFRTDGRLVREWTTQYADRPHTTFYRRAYSRPIGNGINGCTRQFLEALPVLPAPDLHEVFADDGGRFWVHTLGDANQWTVYSRAYRVLGTVTLPPKFDLYQVGSDFVLGHARDDNDVELVVAYHLIIPVSARLAPSAACTETIDSLPVVVTATRSSDFRVVLRNGLTANEAVYSNSGHYARTADALHIDVPSGAKFEVLRLDDHGYVLGVFDLMTNFFCAVGIGTVTPLGWGEGELRCGN